MLSMKIMRLPSRQEKAVQYRPTPSKNSEITAKPYNIIMANIKNIEKHKFKKGQTGNPNGRPRKFLADILHDLKQAGYAEIKPNNVSDVYQALL